MSITVGFITYTTSLVMAVVQIIIFMNFGGRKNAFYFLPLLIHAFIPMFWIHKNEGMKHFAKEMFPFLNVS